MSRLLLPGEDRRERRGVMFFWTILTVIVLVWIVLSIDFNAGTRTASAGLYSSDDMYLVQKRQAEALERIVDAVEAIHKDIERKCK